MTTIALDMSASGRVLNVAPGDRLEIRLEENRTTGFRWLVADEENHVLVLERNTYIGTREGVAGSGGIRKLEFLVAKPGRTTLRLFNRRTWDRDMSADLPFELTVNAESLACHKRGLV